MLLECAKVVCRSLEIAAAFLLDERVFGDVLLSLGSDEGEDGLVVEHLGAGIEDLPVGLVKKYRVEIISKL